MKEIAGLVDVVLTTARQLEARLDGTLRPLGLSLAKVGVLHHLATAQEPIGLGTLAAHQGCVRSNITQLVDRLEKDGLVRRHDHAGDRRCVHAALTPAGERAYARAQRAIAEAQRAILGSLGAAEVAQTRHTLERMGG
jgi:DNA-binding MarR family transcriptional regulator